MVKPPFVNVEERIDRQYVALLARSTPDKPPVHVALDGGAVMPPLPAPAPPSTRSSGTPAPPPAK